MGRWASCLVSRLHQPRQPRGRVIAEFSTQIVQSTHGAFAAGQHRQQFIEAIEVESCNHAVITMLYQKTAGSVGQGSNQVELVRRKAETLDIVAPLGLGVG